MRTIRLDDIDIPQLWRSRILSFIVIAQRKYVKPGHVVKEGIARWGEIGEC